MAKKLVANGRKKFDSIRASLTQGDFSGLSGKNATDRYRSLFDSSQDAIMTLEPPAWKFTSGNPAAIKIFNAKDEKSFLALSPGELSPERQPDGQLSGVKSKKMIDLALKNGSIFFEWTHKRYRGASFPATVLLSRVQEGKNVFLQATVRVISEQKKTEKLLLDQKKEQETILDSIPAWIFYKDSKNNFIKVNQMFANVMKRKKEELEGKSMNDFYPKAQADAYWRDDKTVIASGKPKKNIIEPMKGPSGTLWVQTDKIPYYDDRGGIIGIIGFSIDITAKKMAEDELKMRVGELEKINKLMVGRELKMIELKEKIEDLTKKLNGKK